MTEKRIERRGTIERTALAGVEFKILAGFAAAISLLVLGGTVIYRSGEELASAVQSIARTQEVRAVLADLSGSLAGAHVEARDYFASHDESRFAEYQRLIAVERERLDSLLQLVGDDNAERDDALRLRRLAERALASLADSMQAFEQYGLPAARAVLAASRGANMITRVREATERMDGAQKILVQRRETEAAKVRLTTLSSLLVTLAAAVALFMLLFRGIHREMLARRGAEQAVRDSDRYNRGIIESSPDCVSVLTTGAHITQMTPQGLKLMGIDDFAAVAGLDWCSLWCGEERAAARRAVVDARGGSPGRFHAVTERRGVKQWWDVIVMPILSANGAAERLLAVARDISELKRSESRLLAANRFLDSLIDSLPVMVVVTDVKTLRFVRMNRMCEELLGVNAARMTGKTVYDLLPREQADLTRKSDQEAIATGSLVNVDDRSISTVSGTRVINTKKVPIMDEGGTAQYLLAISTDITASRTTERAVSALNAQLEAKAAQLESSNKELESFSYSVSHDLRAPLRAIDGFAQILQEDHAAALDVDARRCLNVIRDNSKRMGLLIDDLLAFSRLARQTVSNAAVDVELLVREVLAEVLQGDLPHAPGRPPPQIEIGVLPEVRGDRALLKQVWTNLISNAVKYSGQSAHPRIQIGGEVRAGENRYSVKDNGVGFSMAYADKLFGVFQRLHRADEFAGTGVGLAIVHRVVTRHGGKVWAQSRVNEGAEFSFSLPGVI